MNFLDQNNHDTSNLNYSINSSTNPLTQIPSNNNLSLSQDLQNISRQHKPLPITTPACDNNTVGKSNYSSINNILPCPYTEANGFKPKQDQELSKASDRMRSSTASFHENSLSKQKTSLENSLHAERPSTRVSTRPPLNPGDVSKGLSALHQKVDDLIKRGSQIRTSFQGTERLPRAASTENRSHNNPAQVFTLSSIQPEPAEQVVTRNSATTSEAAYVKIHDLSQYSGVSDGRDNTPQLRSSKVPVSPYQNFMSTPNKVNSPRSECKDNKSAFYMEIAKNYSDTKYIRKQEQITSHQVQSPLRESGNFQIEEHKPKYDERKLDAIVSRIKGRNSVSPAPRQRSSVTLQEADRVNSAAIRTSWSTSKKIEDSFAERREERTTSIPINWQVSHITPEEKSIDEIPNEKDHNVTGNTTILELLDKKRSASVSKPREGPFEDENGYRNPARGGKGVPGDKKMRIAVPKPGNGVATATVYLQDILKDLQIEKTAKVGSSKDSKITEEIGLGLGLKEKSLNAVVGNVIVAREEGISTQGKQGLNESPAKRTAKYFTEENEEESDVALKHALRSAGIGTAANPRLQGNMERGRALGNEKKSQNVQKMPSPPKKTEDDSLLLDESVFTVKEGGVNTHRQINLNGKNAKNEGKDVIERNMLDTTCIRNKFLDEEADISDFDFDKNRLDTQEAERSKGNIGASRRFEESYLENLGVKVQRFSVGKGK